MIHEMNLERLLRKEHSFPNILQLSCSQLSRRRKQKNLTKSGKVCWPISSAGKLLYLQSGSLGIRREQQEKKSEANLSKFRSMLIFLR